jgi:hypothetical protein
MTLLHSVANLSIVIPPVRACKICIITGDVVQPSSRLTLLRVSACTFCGPGRYCGIMVAPTKFNLLSICTSLACTA